MAIDKKFIQTLVVFNKTRVAAGLTVSLLGLLPQICVQAKLALIN